MPKKCSRCRAMKPNRLFVTGDVMRLTCEPCRESSRLRMKRYYRENTAAVSARIKARRQAMGVEALRAERAAGARRYRKKNPKRIAAINRTYQKNHRGKIAALRRKREAARICATPPWADLAAIETIYLRAARLRVEGHRVHVEHHYPLRGKKVSGLHVPGNLRIVSDTFNLRKSNRYEVED